MPGETGRPLPPHRVQRGCYGATKSITRKPRRRWKEREFGGYRKVGAELSRGEMCYRTDRPLPAAPVRETRTAWDSVTQSVCRTYAPTHKNRLKGATHGG